MNKIYIYSLIIALLMSCQSNVKDNINTTSYPDSDAVYKKLVKEYTLNEDGSMLYRNAFELKLLTHYSFNRKYGETFIEYDPQYQKLAFNKAFTINGEGKKIVTPENAFNELLPRAASKSGSLNHLREMAVTHTGLELGATIHLDYEITTSADFFPYLIGKEIAAFSSPVQNFELIIKVAESQTLNYHLVDSTKEPEISSKKGFKVYTWTFDNLSTGSSESLSPDESAYKPTVVFSSADNFNQILEYLTSQPAFSYNLDKEMESDIKTKINIWREQHEHLSAMRSFVADEFNYFPVHEELLGFRCKTVEEIWNDNGGNHLENTLLLSSTLNQAGVMAEPVAVVSSDLFTSESCHPLLFENYFIKIDLQNGDSAFINVLDKNTFIHTCTLNDKVIIPLNINNRRCYRMIQSERDLMSAEFELALAQSDELKGECSITFKNGTNPYMELLCQENYSKSLIRGAEIQSSSVERSNLTNSQLSLNLTISAKTQDEYCFIELPAFKQGINAWHISELSRKRSNPLELPCSIIENYLYVIELNERYVPFDLPENMEINNDAGILNLSFVQEENTLIIRRSIDLMKKRIDPDNYSNFRELISVWTDQKNNQLILRKI
jgi:hypothetical protein